MRDVAYILIVAAACGSLPPPAPAGGVASKGALSASGSPLADAGGTGSSVPPRASDGIDGQKCVVDSIAHAARYTLDHHGAALAERLGRPAVLSDLHDPHCFTAEAIPDLDGDGMQETSVSEGCSWGTFGALHMVYLSNHGCRKFGGGVISGELSPLDTSSAGVRDVEATWSNGCAGRDFTWTRYRWAGHAYEVAETATCTFCDQLARSSPGSNAHSHCKRVARQFSARGP